MRNKHKEDHDDEEENNAACQTYVKAFVSAFTGVALCTAAYFMRKTVVLGGWATYVDAVGLTFIGDAVVQINGLNTVEPPPKRNEKHLRFVNFAHGPA